MESVELISYGFFGLDVLRVRGLDVLCVRVVASHVLTLLLFFTYVEFRMVIVRMLELHMLCVRFDSSRVST